MSTFSPLRQRSLVFSLVLVLSSLVAACGGDDSSGAATGTASMDVTDAPADDVTTVKLTISAVSLKPENGDPQYIEFDEPVVIENLLALQEGNVAALLPDTRFPAGRYNWLRLYVIGGGSDSWVMTDQGEQYDLFVPGQQTANGQPRHIQLVSGFVIPAGGNVDFTLDIDLRRALTRPAGADHYLVRPAMRIMDNSETGSISGTVADTLVTAEGCSNDLAADEGNAVYLYGGADAVTGDVHVDDLGVDVGDDNPIATANVRQDPESGAYEYAFGFVPAGDYTVAFTCNALDDMPDADDDLAFSAQANIVVLAGENTVQDFTAQVPEAP